MAYAGAVYVVVNSAKLFQRDEHHIVDTSLVGNVDFHRCCLEIGMRGESTALSGSGLSTFYIDVCKKHTSGSGLSKSNRCLLANAASGL